MGCGASGYSGKLKCTHSLFSVTRDDTFHFFPCITFCVKKVHVMTEKEILATCLKYEEIARKEISEKGILTDERYKEAMNLLTKTTFSISSTTIELPEGTEITVGDDQTITSAWYGTDLTQGVIVPIDNNILPGLANDSKKMHRHNDFFHYTTRNNKIVKIVGNDTGVVDPSKKLWINVKNKDAMVKDNMTIAMGEQEALQAAFGNFKIEVYKLQGLLTDWLFDEKNWEYNERKRGQMGPTEKNMTWISIIEMTAYNGYGEDSNKFQQSNYGAFFNKWAASWEPILQMFRKIRSTEAVAIMEMVDTFVARLYSEIEGTPGPVTNTTKEGEDVYQNVPKLFDPKTKRVYGKPHCVTRFTDLRECGSEGNNIQNVYKEAALLIKNGYLPCGPGSGGRSGDEGVFEVREAESLNRVSYSTYLIAQGILIQEEFHQEAAKAVANVPNVTFRPAPHKKFERFNGKAFEYEHEGVPLNGLCAIKDSVRGSVVCNDHASLIAAHNALLASPVFEGKITKDRREERSCRDVLQVVLFKGFLCEVQFHFKSTLPLKVFSHAAYNIKRPEDQDLNGLRTIFEFPMFDMASKSRNDVRCKLHI